jgi:hypothetical protein
MRYLVIVLLTVAVLFAAENNKIHVPNRVVKSQPTELEKFLKHIAYRESNNTRNIVNKFGMMGKYQFSPNTVRGLGFKVTKKEFLQNEELQDSVMVAYMRQNNRELNSIIKKYDGKVVKGVQVTRSGILAAAHLGGSQSVVNYFSTDDWTGLTDANGTSIREYMKTFSKYKLQNKI